MRIERRRVLPILLFAILTSCTDIPTSLQNANDGAPQSRLKNGLPGEWVARDLGPGNGARINNHGHVLDGRRIWRQGRGWRSIPIDGYDIADRVIVGVDDQSRLVTLSPGNRLRVLDFAGLTTRFPVYADVNARGTVVGWVEPEPLDFRYFAWLAEARSPVRLKWHTFHEFETCCINDLGDVLVREWGGGHGALMILGGFDLLRDVTLDLYPVDLNNELQIVGRRLVRDQNDEPYWFAFYWSAKTGYVEPTDAENTVFRAINNRGIVVGSRNGRAVAWTPGSGFVDLGVGAALDINDRNEIVGLRDERVVLWHPARQ